MSSINGHEVKSTEYFWEMFPLPFQTNVPTLQVWISLLIHKMFASACHYCLLLPREFHSVSSMSACLVFVQVDNTLHSLRICSWGGKKSHSLPNNCQELLSLLEHHTKAT